MTHNEKRRRMRRDAPVQIRKADTRMQFEFTRRRSVRSPVTDAPTFKVGRLADAGKTGRDMSHLIDRSYNYQNADAASTIGGSAPARELHWHLADRLGLAPNAVSLRETIAA